MAYMVGLHGCIGEKLKNVCQENAYMACIRITTRKYINATMHLAEKPYMQYMNMAV
jgi:hypothetical protein